MAVMSSISRPNSASSTPPSPFWPRTSWFPAVRIPERAQRMPKVKPGFKPQIVIFVSIVCLCLTASASAMTDPRKCSSNQWGHKPGYTYDCARTAARDTVKTWLTRQGQRGNAYCTPLYGNPLRWTCLVTGGLDGTATVIFRRTTHGWIRRLSFVATVNG